MTQDLYGCDNHVCSMQMIYLSANRTFLRGIFVRLDRFGRQKRQRIIVLGAFHTLGHVGTNVSLSFY